MGTDPKYTTVRAGERLDNLAYRLLGDSTKVQQVLNANPGLDIWSPRPGQVIRVPDAS